jgi:Leucine-rich repeat (LRR) protein
VFQNIVAKQSSQSADSTLEEMRIIRERSITGYRKVYHASTNFITYDSLLKIKDFSKVKEVSLVNYPGKKIPLELYQCKNLAALELVNTKVQRLKNLKKLPQLTSVYVLNNKPLRSLKLSKSKSIRTFGARGTNPELLPTSFGRLVALEKLDLISSDLQAFPVGWNKNRNLKELLLTNNRISSFPDYLTPVPSLEKLELQRNNIQAIPASVQNLRNLKKLSLNYNSIEKVDPAIAKLSKLEELSFYNNKLTSIPAGVYDLQGLQAVDFYYNQIERIDGRIGNLKTLEVLYLSNNRLISVPETIGELTNLQELYISNNRLSDLPEGIKKLEKLKVFRVNNNNLTSAPKDLHRLTMLENLDISNNQINELPTQVSELNNLKLLVMVNNPWDNEAIKQLADFAKKLQAKEVMVKADGID